MTRRQTPSQTIGPFFRPALIEAGAENLVHEGTRGERVTIEGRVIDGDGAAVSDAMLEIWQANADGKYDHPEDDQEKLLDPIFHGYGRIGTDTSGTFRFHTIKPGALPDRRRSAGTAPQYFDFRARAAEAARHARLFSRRSA